MPAPALLLLPFPPCAATAGVGSQTDRKHEQSRQPHRRDHQSHVMGVSSVFGHSSSIRCAARRCLRNSSIVSRSVSGAITARLHCLCTRISELPPLTGNQFYYHEVIGFQVIDKEKGDIGICKDFIDVSNQPIMQVDKDGKEILIPAVDDIFEEVDREQRILRVAAPEGLIDIYLEG